MVTRWPLLAATELRDVPRSIPQVKDAVVLLDFVAARVHGGSGAFRLVGDRGLVRHRVFSGSHSIPGCRVRVQKRVRGGLHPAVAGAARSGS